MLEVCNIQQRRGNVPPRGTSGGILMLSLKAQKAGLGLFRDGLCIGSRVKVPGNSSSTTAACSASHNW